MKKFCKEYFDKAVAKHRAYEQRKLEKHTQGPDSKSDGTPQAPSDDEALDDVKMSDDERDKVEEKETPASIEDLQGAQKRKRSESNSGEGGLAGDETTLSSAKRPRSSTPPPPPPPPPPPDDSPRDEGETPADQSQSNGDYLPNMNDLERPQFGIEGRV